MIDAHKRCIYFSFKCDLWKYHKFYFYTFLWFPCTNAKIAFALYRLFWIQNFRKKNNIGVMSVTFFWYFKNSKNILKNSFIIFKACKKKCLPKIYAYFKLNYKIYMFKTLGYSFNHLCFLLKDLLIYIYIIKAACL